MFFRILRILSALMPFQSDADQKLYQYATKVYMQEIPEELYAMSEAELYYYCRKRGLSDADCKIAKLIIYDRLKGKELYDAINYSERQTKRKRTKIVNKLK